MAKAVVDAVLDGLLDVIATANIIVVCSAQPTNWTELVTTYALADIAVTPGDGMGDFTIADDVSGRKVTVAEQANVDIDADGIATHIGFGISGANTFLGCTTCTSQQLYSTGTVTIPAWKANVQDPT